MDVGRVFTLISLYYRIEDFHQISTSVIQPPTFQMLLFENGPSELISLVLPPVILWDPLTQFPLYRSHLESCPHEACDGILCLHTWTIGNNKGTQPRLLHDTHTIVLLVGAVYKCTNSHTIFSTDPRLIQRIDKNQLPFVLLHRTGFTRMFIHSVVSLAQEMSILGIARYIKNVREEYVAELALQLSKDYNVYH